MYTTLNRWPFLKLLPLIFMSAPVSFRTADTDIVERPGPTPEKIQDWFAPWVFGHCWIKVPATLEKLGTSRTRLLFSETIAKLTSQRN
jgi:hypothetical protein